MPFGKKANAVWMLACLAAMSSGAFAQARAPIDVRNMAPGLQSASEPVAAAKPAGALTRNQRQQATLQARQDGALAPAGEAADLRADRSPASTRSRVAVAPPVSSDAPLPPPTATIPATAAAPMPPTVLADATAPAKKRPARKAVMAKAGADASATATIRSRARPSRAPSAPA